MTNKLLNRNNLPNIMKNKYHCISLINQIFVICSFTILHRLVQLCFAWVVLDFGDSCKWIIVSLNRLMCWKFGFQSLARSKWEEASCILTSYKHPVYYYRLTNCECIYYLIYSGINETKQHQLELTVSCLHNHSANL